jgi:hypothetical protein
VLGETEVVEPGQEQPVSKACVRGAKAVAKQ